MAIERRDPGMILVLAFFTCGLYLIYWYYKMYEELEQLTGRTPTGMSFVADFLLTIVTCSLYGIWVDYKISLQLYEMQVQHRYPAPNDTSTAAILLDVAAFVTGFVTNYVSSALQQDQLNKLMQWRAMQPVVA